MSVCRLNQDGEIVGHRHRPTSPAALLRTMAPSREHLVIAVECLCTWYWLADVWARAGMPLVLGHALAMQAIPGGQATHDTSDAQKIAARLHGRMLPQASGYPTERRATRAWLLGIQRSSVQWRGAAPHPNLSLTGQRYTLSHLVA
jgi:hypothetical protein